MDAHREAAAVILHLYRAIVLDGDDDIRAVAGQRLVHGVVHNFIYAMMQSAVIGRADIHAGTLSDGLQSLQNLDLAGLRRNGSAHDQDSELRSFLPSF